MSTHPPEESGPEEHGRSGARWPESGARNHEPEEHEPEAHEREERGSTEPSSPEFGPEQFPVADSGGQPAVPAPAPTEGTRSSGTEEAESEDDFDRRWAEITERLGTLADPAAPGPRDYPEEVEADEDHFVPPDPGPLLPRDPRNLLPWSGAVGGPMAVLIILVFWPSAPSWAYFAALTAMVAGLLTIWWRLPQRRADSGGDNGAVV